MGGLCPGGGGSLSRGWGGVSRGVSVERGVSVQGVSVQGEPPVNRMTHVSKNITLPQTSFAGGQNAICFDCT